MLLTDFITVHNATTNVKNRPNPDNLSLGENTVNGEVVCNVYRRYESNYIPICNAFKYFDPTYRINNDETK